MLNVVLVAIGGALGSVARYGVSLAAARWLGLGFPYGTLVVNVTGSFAMGVLMAWLGRHVEMPPEWRLFLAVGVLGGYTTFSSFSLDAVGLWEGGAHGMALLYVGLSTILGLLALAAGLALVRQFG